MERFENSQGQAVNLVATDLTGIVNMSDETAAAIIAGISPEIIGRISCEGDRSSKSEHPSPAIDAVSLERKA